MVVLDTDHMSLLERSGEEGARIRERLRAVPPDDAATTVISYEEQVRGWLARIAQAQTDNRLLTDYSELRRQLRNYCRIAILEFDARAQAEFRRLRAAGIRIGTMDLRIACVAIVNDAVLLSRNLSDFEKVPGLKVEDWSR